MAQTSSTQRTVPDRRALVLALTAMLCGGVLLHLYISELEARATGGAKLSVLVATRDAPIGTSITRTMLGLRELPQAYVESRHIAARDLDKVLGAALQAPMRATEAILWTDINGTTAALRPLSSRVRAGMRAFSVRAEQGPLGELLEPGDRVDVVLVPAPTSGTTADDARTLLEGVLVLAVDGRVHADDEQERRSHAGAGVTLAVTREQGLVLANAERSGSLRLLLRNPDDIPPEAIDGVAATVPRGAP